MNKKIIVSLLASLGLLVAMPAFGAAIAQPITGKTTIQSAAPTSGMMQAQTISQPVYSTQSAEAFRVMPCNTLDQSYGYGSNMMYGNPCGQIAYNGMMSAAPFGYNNHQAEWYELMFILTVMLVWVVLLLLIGVLWKQLKKHKSS